MFICTKYSFDKSGSETAAVEYGCISFEPQEGRSISEISKHLTSVFYSSISDILINSVYEYDRLHEGFDFVFFSRTSARLSLWGDTDIRRTQNASVCVDKY